MVKRAPDLPRITIFALFCLLTLWLAFHHEPWRDELDPWLMARDADLMQIVAISPDAGHPPLWQFLLKIPVSLGLDYRAMAGLHLMIAWGAASLLLFKSPFPPLVSAAVLFNYYFAFEYAVVARNYAPAIMGLFLYLSTRALSVGRGLVVRRFAWILMCLSSVFSLICAACFLLFENVKRSKNGKLQFTLNRETGFQVLIVLIAVMILWPSGSGQFSGQFFKIPNFLAPFDAMATMLFPVHAIGHLEVVSSLLFLGGVIFIAIRTGMKATAFLLLSLAGLATLFTWIHYYPRTPRYAGMILVYIMVALWFGGWRQSPGGKSSWKILSGFPAGWLLMFLFFVQLPLNLSVWYQETTLPYTDAPASATAIEQAGGESRIVVCSPPTVCGSILARMNPKVRFFYPGLGFGSYGLWNLDHARSAGLAVAPGIALNLARQELGQANLDARGSLFVSGYPLDDPAAHGARMVREIEPRAWAVKNEAMFIYELVD